MKNFSPAKGLTPGKIAPLLFGSGFCALVYQIAWQREFRLIFGASTAASAAVLAIFIGGLGIGGLWLGRRADRHAQPLALYARWETMVALAAAATPLLLPWVQKIYIYLGGTIALGIGFGSAVRLVLSGLVLAVPTVLMGGTLPAAARAVETDEDQRRGAVAILYGANTLGAVAGCVLSTFFMLEALGTVRTLLVASLINLLVALIARSLARRSPPRELSTEIPAAPEEIAAAPAGFVLLSAAIVGFAFFLMELVWYRVLGPLLGGTVFSFGLILAIALAGIGLGGNLYGLGRRRATLSAFAATCLLEALFIAIPYALGDRIAILALLFRPLTSLGFAGSVLGWTSVAAIVVLPASLIAGLQFSLLIALLGNGRREVGRQIGLTYAANTLGAMAGALAGGFGLMPRLGAPGCWKMVAMVLALLGTASLALSALRERRAARFLLPFATLVAIIFALRAPGPTAVWRHSQIGVGRVPADVLSSANRWRAFENSRRHAIKWEAEGVESSVALAADQGALHFIINGKIDGDALTDAATQVMVGLLGAILHPDPKRALVIGLGTGSTAGWLGAVPTMDRVDVVELEPKVLEVARACAPVNEDAMNNPKVHVLIDDAREVLLTSKEKYDLIASEPSNPYRAGIASLFTQEFYRAVSDRLGEDGIFLQWVQAYNVDSRTVRTIYATLQSVFPSVETWQLHPADLLLVASKHPGRYSAAQLRAKIASAPYASALAQAWRVVDLEGFFSHYVARPTLAADIANVESDYLNTDDQPYIEFGFARSSGTAAEGAFSVTKVRELARARGEDHPPINDETALDWDRVEDERIAMRSEYGALPQVQRSMSDGQRARAEAYSRYAEGSPSTAIVAWRKQSREPVELGELDLVAEGFAATGDESALPYIDVLRRSNEIEANALMALLRFRQGNLAEATSALESALYAYRESPWPAIDLMDRALTLAQEIAKAAHDPKISARLLATLTEPFSVAVLDGKRLSTRLNLATMVSGDATREALAQYEPYPPWQASTLLLRREAYRDTPLAAQAEKDLQTYFAAEPSQFSSGLPAAPSMK